MTYIITAIISAMIGGTVGAAVVCCCVAAGREDARMNEIGGKTDDT